MPPGMDMRRLVGRNFARIRREKRLTQLSRFSQQCLCGLDLGQRTPTVVSLYELAQALGVTPIDLLSDESEKGAARRPKRG